MKKALLLLTLIVCNTISFANQLPTSSVVKLFVKASSYNYLYPWATPQINSYVGSGVIIDGNQILTSAHVVNGAKFIEVQKENDPNTYFAKVKYISNQADLALVEVVDNNFFNNTKPLKLNENVKPRDELTVLGYPIGGQTISATTGVISRIEYASYVWSGEDLLAIQVDAAINPGNSGGPAIDNDGNIVGIVMMGRKNASNIAYIVPAVVISTFLEDTKDGHVDGFAEEDISVIYLLSSTMKEYYGLNGKSGILITNVGYYVQDFKKNDILLEINGKTVADDGTIDSEFGRVNFSLVANQKQVGNSIEVKVLRDKKVVAFTHKLTRKKSLIQKEYAEHPRYFIYGGLTFAPLTKNYTLALGDVGNIIDMAFYGDKRASDLDEPVIWMQPIFPLQVNKGIYSGAYIVTKVNGIKIKNFKQFVDLVDNTKEKYVVIETLENSQVILPVKEAKESFSEIKLIYGLQFDRYLGTTNN